MAIFWLSDSDMYNCFDEWSWVLLDAQFAGDSDFHTYRVYQLYDKKGATKTIKKKDYGVSKVTEYVMQKLNLSLMCNTWHTILSYNFHTLSLLLSYLKILVEHSLFITYANANS